MARCVLVAIVALLAGCGGSSLSPGPTVSPAPVSTPTSAATIPVAADEDILGDWELVGGRISGLPVMPLPFAPVTMTVTESRVRGQTTCNGFQGELERLGATFSVGDMARSAMACEPVDPIMVQENRFLGALTSAQDASIVKERLVLSGPDAELVFARIGELDLTEIVDRTWELTTLLFADAAPQPAAADAILELGSDGSINFTTGCRTSVGQFVVERGEIRVTSLTAEGDCPAQLRDKSGHVEGTLGDDWRPRLIDGALVITSKWGTGLSYTQLD